MLNRKKCVEKSVIDVNKKENKDRIRRSKSSTLREFGIEFVVRHPPQQ